MEQSYPGKLQVWTGWTAVQAPESVPPILDPALVRRFSPGDLADQLYADETLRLFLPRPRPAESAEPYTLQWFLEIEGQRHGRYGRWIPRLLEFTKHAGETLLGLGYGLGTDWVQYARHGAAVVVCSPSVEQLALARRNFELRGLSARFMHSVPASLPLESASIDVVCVSNLFGELRQPDGVVDEIWRVLKPGGKVLAVLPAKYGVCYWSRLLTPWRHWLKGWPEQAEMMLPSYSARALRRRFGRFIEHRVHKRQLRRSEVPLCWRWLPPSVLERAMGRLLVLKAFKPLSAAMALPLAA
jgi:SAM-dependent methyltransferase